MANRYWIGDGGTWDTTDTTHWSASTGGAGGASVPTVSDDVFFDANSFTVGSQTVAVNSNPITYKSMNWTGVTNSPTFNQNSADMDFDGDITLVAGMTYSSGASQSFYAVSTSGSATTINLDFAGHDIGNCGLVNNRTSGGTLTINLLSDFLSTGGAGLVNFASNASSVSVIFNTNNYDMTCTGVNNGISADYETSTTRGFTFNLGTSTISTRLFSVSSKASPVINGADATLILSGSMFFRVDTANSSNNLTGTLGTLKTTGSGPNGIFHYPAGFKVTTFEGAALSNTKFNEVNNSTGETKFIFTNFTTSGTSGNRAIIQGTLDQTIIYAENTTLSYPNVVNLIADSSSPVVPFDASNGGLDSGGNVNFCFSNCSPGFIPRCQII